ncbi:MAG: hypothetical protein IPJ81_01905 [Chitinophagaceae bacterium]|nr:hypothetical protein [Chitinophagaceae bacterium]
MFFSRKKKQGEHKTEKKEIDINALVNDVINHLELEKQGIIDKALSVDIFFNSDWDTYLLSWNVTPRNINEREDDLKTGIPVSKGALPVEVREVFIRLKEKYDKICKELRGNYAKALQEEDEIEEKLWEFEHRKLSDFVETETKKYIKKIKKPVDNSLDNLLQNAEQNKNKWSSNLQDAKSYMIRCKSCGAARLLTDQYDNCKFCGSELFEKIEQYKSMFGFFKKKDKTEKPPLSNGSSFNDDDDGDINDEEQEKTQKGKVVPSAKAQELITKWEDLLKRIQQKALDILKEAEEKSQPLINETLYDTQAIHQLWSAIKKKAVDNLGEKVDEGWEKFSDLTSEADLTTNDLDLGEVGMLRDETNHWLAVEYERYYVRVVAKAAKKIWENALQDN